VLLHISNILRLSVSLKTCMFEPNYHH